MMNASQQQQVCPEPRGDMPRREHELKVKVHLKKTGKIRKFRMNRSEVTFSALKSKILEICNIKLPMIGIEIQYKDEDGDMVLCTSDEELSIALEESAANGKFTISVYEINIYDDFD